MINASPASIICFNNLVVAVVTGVGTLRLFAEEAPIDHRATWRHHRLSLHTVHPWDLQDLKKIYSAIDPPVAEVAT